MNLASLIEFKEQALVEKFVAHPAVEILDEGILLRLARRGEGISIWINKLHCTIRTVPKP
jgi:hypothetical protein